MKTSAIIAALFASTVFAPVHAYAQDTKGKTIQFPLTVSGGASKCLPNASGTVTDTTLGPVENLHVLVKGLPPKTGFDLFNIQVPDTPFGLAWYLGDIQTDAKGNGVGNFVGRFNIETFIISLGALASPNVFPKPPAFLAQSTTGAVTNGPVQIYHLGLWFNSTSDATKAGCPGTATPFNGEHNAGIQVLKTQPLENGLGPLSGLQ